MNYLAHLYFSDPSPLAWAGSLMGDFFKGSHFADLPEELVRHLKLHRYIDSFTRVNNAFQTSRRRLDASFRHGRSVLVDVFYDHLLACQWREYHDSPLTDFSQQVYRGLQACHGVLSPGLQEQLPRMIEYDWLSSYRQPPVVERVLQRLETRLKHKLPLASGFSELDRWRNELECDFTLFMNDLRSAVEQWKSCH